jgi:methyltransferase
MTSLAWYRVLLAVVALERAAELVVARRNAHWALARGGVEYGRDHYPVMVALHVMLLVGCVLEPVVCRRPFLPWLGWPSLAVAIACQLVRWSCVAALGRRWNTRVIVVPGMPPVVRGPYHWLRHPNYAAVLAEGVALPLIHTAWVTALAFTLANLPLLRRRIQVEDAALGRHGGTSQRPALHGA